MKAMTGSINESLCTEDRCAGHVSSSKDEGRTQHLCTDNEAPNHAAPDDHRLQDIEAVEGGDEGVLHFLVVPDGLLKVAPLQVLVAEVLDGFIVEQGVCGLGLGVICLQ